MWISAKKIVCDAVMFENISHVPSGKCETCNITMMLFINMSLNLISVSEYVLFLFNISSSPISKRIEMSGRWGRWRTAVDTVHLYLRRRPWTHWLIKCFSLRRNSSTW
jgi:hypothetical protein